MSSADDEDNEIIPENIINSRTSPRYILDENDEINNEIISGSVINNVEIDTDDELNNVPAEDGLNITEEANIRDLNKYRCVVCDTVPFKELYRCPQGHSMCAGCYQIRVLDKMLGAEMGTCPQCRVRIYRQQQNRNFVGERRLSAIVVACEKCELQLPRGQLRLHGIKDCPKRLVVCKYKRIGCKWKGTIGILSDAHMENCEYRYKTGYELLEGMCKIQEKRDAKQSIVANIIKFLQLPNITSRLLHVKSQCESFPRNSFAALSTFDAFGKRWSVKFKWQTPNNAVEPIDQDIDNCAVLFQLCLETVDGLEARGPLGLTYTMVSGVHSDVRFQPNLCEKFDFTRDTVNGPPTFLYENSWRNVARLLNKRGFYVRLLMARI